MAKKLVLLVNKLGFTHRKTKFRIKIYPKKAVLVLVHSSIELPDYISLGSNWIGEGYI